MELQDMATCLQEMYDNLLIYHGYTPYMRDYEMIVLRSAAQESELDTRFLRFLFRSCPEALVRSIIGAQVWSKSMGDDLLQPRRVTARAGGYVWGVQCQELYPGAKIIENSELARNWSMQVGARFHEVEVKANAQQINLIYSDLVVDEVSAGYTPFTVGNRDTEEYAKGISMPLQESGN